MINPQKLVNVTPLDIKVDTMPVNNTKRPKSLVSKASYAAQIEIAIRGMVKIKTGILVKIDSFIRINKDSFAYFLFDIIPGLEFAEAAAFIDNSLLTSDAQAIKNKFWLDENEGGYKKMSLLHSDPQAYFELLKNAGGAEA